MWYLLHFQRSSSSIHNVQVCRQMGFLGPQTFVVAQVRDTWVETIVHLGLAQLVSPPETAFNKTLPCLRVNRVNLWRPKVVIASTPWEVKTRRSMVRSELLKWAWRVFMRECEVWCFFLDDRYQRCSWCRGRRNVRGQNVRMLLARTHTAHWTARCANICICGRIVLCYWKSYHICTELKKINYLT